MSNLRAAGKNGARSAAPADNCLRVAVPAGYDRVRDLPRLLPLWDWEIETLNEADHARLLARLRRALRAERQRGLGGHWTYDLARHAQLLRAYRAEVVAYLSVGSATKAAPQRVSPKCE